METGFGQRIKAIRKNNKMTMEELADQLNKVFPDEDKSNLLAKGTISKWENEKAKPSFHSMMKFCKYFKISLDCLTSDESIETSEKDVAISKNLTYLEIGKTTYHVNKNIDFKSGNTGLFKIPNTENSVIRKGQIFDGNILLTAENGEQNLYKSNEVELIGVVVSKEIKMI
ncbi:helix-turn-helix domain-containing protein [Staphylococcus shinii]|uniref:helix-turn-helix domain-containing protein n=1 Tax=Staphylococcus shinii TaxID=2912228 RepID=UPI003F56C91D